MEKKKKREIPHVFVILFIIIIIAMIATWIIPAGSYERYVDEASGKTLIDPNSFKYTESSWVDPFEMLVDVQKGLISAAQISFLIFIAFATIYLVQATGAIDAAIAWMIKKTKANPTQASLILVLLMVGFAVWGSTGTFSYEEIIAFVPIFVSIAVALGYDPMMGVAISVVPVGVGFAASTINPFTVGVAQTIAEVPMFSGLSFRIIILAVFTILMVGYVMWYANRIKKDPSKSITAGLDIKQAKMDESKLNTEFTPQRKWTLAAMFVGIVFMAWGLITQGWYINQCSGIFLAIAIVVGIINRWSPNKIAGTFTQGLSAGVLSALIVGVARAVLEVLTEGGIIDTIIHAFATGIEGLSLYASGVGLLIFQTLLNFIIPSGSGQAAVAMPIMTPLADLIGMSRQTACLIFQFGDGFSNLLWPTSFMPIACAIAGIPLGKYYKWIVPFFLISFVAQIIFIFIALAIGF